MYLLTVSAQVSEPPLAPGSYLAPDAAALEIAAMNPFAVRLTQAPVFVKEFRPELDWNGKRVLVTLLGCGGDILMTTPSLRKIKTVWPKCHVTFACFPGLAQLLENNPFVDEVIPHLIEIDAFSKFDAVVWLDDNGREEVELGREVPAIDLHAKKFGFTLSEKERSLVYEVTYQEKESILLRFPKTDRKRIVVQISARAAARTWPKTNLRDFTMLAIKKNLEVVWIGFPHETGAGKTPPPDWLIDATRSEPELTLRESAALLSTADGVVCPDSLFYHISSALGIPGVGLFAAFDSQMRSSSDTMYNINGRVGCDLAPCFHQAGRPGTYNFPKAGPCSSTGQCEAMANIEGDRVLSLLVRQMERT